MPLDSPDHQNSPDPPNPLVPSKGGSQILFFFEQVHLRGISDQSWWIRGYLGVILVYLEVVWRGSRESQPQVCLKGPGGLVHPEVGLGVYDELRFIRYLSSNYLHHVTRHCSKVAAVYAVSRPSGLGIIRSVSALFARSLRV